MKKFLYIFMLSVFSVFCTYAEDTIHVVVTHVDSIQVDTVKHWNFNGQGSFTFSQIHLDNWAAGGEKSISGLMVLNFSLQYNKNKLSWENDLDINLGMLRQDAKPVVKSDDQIDFSSKLGIEAKKNLYYTTLINLKTQMFNGYDPENTDSLISAYFSPAYINLSIGLDYKYKKVFSLILAPVSGKVTIVNNDALSAMGSFGIDPGKNIKAELGSLLKTTIKKEIIKNVILKSKLELFSKYSIYIKEIDMNWESSVNMSINKHLTTNVILHLIYDHDVKPVLQLKEVFGLGLTYKF